MNRDEWGHTPDALIQFIYFPTRLWLRWSPRFYKNARTPHRA